MVSLTKVGSETIMNRKHYLLKLAGRTILPFNHVYKGKLVSGLHNRNKNTLEIVVTISNI